MDITRPVPHCDLLPRRLHSSGEPPHQL
ncbi:hypothetical protein EK904_012234 [Melospiza melodia maxima]|nr:hypothetical protein EK904_012234 [Melospiza melodia maxima]